MKKRMFVALLCLSWAQLGLCDAVSETLQAKLNAIKTMSANFKQVVKAKTREISRSSGTMALERPGRFRWQTKQPMPQLVVADGQHLWVYDVDLEQVTVKRQAKGLGGTAALFLSGYGDTVTRDFNVTVTHKAKQDTFDLRSKSTKANFQRVILTFSESTMTSIELFDQLGQHTEVGLTQIKNNPTLPTKLFTFKVPQGVDVVKQ